MLKLPSFVPPPMQAQYSTDEASRFQASQPASGPYFAQILQDDAPTYFDLSWTMPLQIAQGFRAWLRLNDSAVRNGAQFEIDLPIEDGIVTQVASFTPDGIPQRTGEAGNVQFYSARVMVRKLAEPTEGFEEDIITILEMGGSALLDVIVNVDLPRI